jgi:hypothetical protein
MGRGKPVELFPTDKPVPSDALIGRHEDVSEIAAKMRAGVNTVLTAPRRTGKTTACDAALVVLAGEGDYIVDVDLFLVDSIGRLADALITGAMRNRPALRQALHTAKQSGRTIYESLGVSITPKLLGGSDLEGIDISVLPHLPSDPVAHLDYALQLPQRIAAADKKRLVLYIDEFQDVKRIGDNWKRGWSVELKRKMRAAFQRSPDISFLFAGSLEHMMRDMFGSPAEPFFQFGGFHSLRPITADEWRQGLSVKLADDRTRIDASALDLIVERGQEHPRSTMLLTQHAHLNSILAQTRHITLELALLSYESCLTSECPKHEVLVDRIRNLGKPAVNRAAIRVIVAIANGGKPYSGARSSMEISRALSALQDAGLVEHHGQTWRVIDPLFAEYLRRSQI